MGQSQAEIGGKNEPENIGKLQTIRQQSSNSPLFSMLILKQNHIQNVSK